MFHSQLEENVEDCRERIEDIEDQQDRLLDLIEKLAEQIGYKLVYERTNTISSHWEKIKKNQRKDK